MPKDRTKLRAARLASKSVESLPAKCAYSDEAVLTVRRMVARGKQWKAIRSAIRIETGEWVTRRWIKAVRDGQVRRAVQAKIRYSTLREFKDLPADQAARFFITLAKELLKAYDLHLGRTEESGSFSEPRREELLPERLVPPSGGGRTVAGEHEGAAGGPKVLKRAPRAPAQQPRAPGMLVDRSRGP